ncbi:MAG: HAD-IA family hydrolase [Desulfobacterales bacterium]|nr:HAD-IA family hydrolase [Desulfobacterales bacterium]
MKPGLVIFDCDGVLVDSEPIASRIFCDLVNEAGLAITYEQTVQDFEGISDEDCIKIVEERLGRPLPDNFMDQHDKKLFEAFFNDLKPIEGIHGALNQISIPTCVASSGPHKKMNVSLKITNLKSFFEGKIFSATEVKRGKPHPDLFLYVANKMGVAPDACVVVEDSVFGVRAGIAAGMTVLGYAARTTSDSLSAEGAVTFKKMNNLPNLLMDIVG